LGAEDIGSAAWGQAAIAPAVTPIDEPKPLALVIGASGLAQALATAALAAPAAGPGGMARALALILAIDHGVR